MSTAYGPIKPASAVEDAVVAHLAAWFSQYLAEVERQEGITAGTIARPRSVSVSTDVELTAEDQLPSLHVVSAGTVQQAPQRSGRGEYRAPWAVGVMAVVSAPDHDTTRRMAQLYASAIRACIVQRPGSGPAGVEEVIWLDERWDPLPETQDARTLQGAQVTFLMWTEDVVAAFEGPGPHGVPQEDPLDILEPWPQVVDAGVTVTPAED